MIIGHYAKVKVKVQEVRKDLGNVNFIIDDRTFTTSTTSCIGIQELCHHDSTGFLIDQTLITTNMMNFHQKTWVCTLGVVN